MQQRPDPRTLVEQRIEDLISLLDFLDRDPDLEPSSDDEPSLGWAEMEARFNVYLAVPDVDLEERGEDEGAEHDGREPSLGWQNEGPQHVLIKGTTDDREEQCEDEGSEHGGREPDVDDEPNYPAPPAGYVGFNPRTGQPIVEDAI